MKPMKCSEKDSKNKSNNYSLWCQVMFKSDYFPLLCLMKFSKSPETSWETPLQFWSKTKIWLWMVLNNSISPSIKKNGNSKHWSNYIIILKSNNVLFIATPKQESMSWLKDYKKNNSLFHLCMEIWNKLKEIWLWKNSELDAQESLLPLIYLLEVSIFNKFTLLSIMISPLLKKNIFTELVDLVVSVEKGLLSTLLCLKTINLLKKSKNSTILKSKKCH